MASINVEYTKKFVGDAWDSTIVPTLSEYIRIPNVSPMFDADWATNGHVDRVVELFTNWIKEQNIPGLEFEVLRAEKKTPLIFITVESTATSNFKGSNILMYGHLDKQPPLTETWREGLHPYIPTIENGKLYGRGGADDGYALFAALTAIKSLKTQSPPIPHGKIVVVIEASEESGSPDLMPYVEGLKDKIGNLDLIICLDSGCGTYDQLWLTTSLRGVASGNLRVDVLKNGCHSGHATGIVPSSFRIIRNLINRIEDVNTGEILVPECHCEIPLARLEQSKSCAAALGNSILDELSWIGAVHPIDNDLPTLLINKTWKPTLAVTGVDGIPALSVAGNVLRPYTSLKLSIRMPPRANATKAIEAVKATLEKDPPYGSKVTFSIDKAGGGWDAPPLSPWLEKSIHFASNTFFNKPANFLGEGGTIPFMGMLGEMFPQAQFVVTGLLGPESNAHGPNEMLVIEMGKSLTACVAQIVHDHHDHFSA